jgi:hypothetical protein
VIVEHLARDEHRVERFAQLPRARFVDHGVRDVHAAPFEPRPDRDNQSGVKSGRGRAKQVDHALRIDLPGLEQPIRCPGRVAVDSDILGFEDLA